MTSDFQVKERLSYKVDPINTTNPFLDAYKYKNRRFGKIGYWQMGIKSKNAFHLYQGNVCLRI